MFRHMVWIDLKRGFSPVKFITRVLAVSILMFFSVWRDMQPALEGNNLSWYGAVDFLELQMMFDSYKVIIVILLCSLYVGSICKDVKCRYQRLILSRTGLQTYAASRFFANTILTVAASILSCYLFSAAVVAVGFPIITEDAGGGVLIDAYYKEWMKAAPYLYIGFIGLQFGMIVSAFGSIGLLFSAYQQDSFVCVGVSAFAFFMMVSASGYFLGSPFDVLTLMGMQSTLPAGRDTPPILMMAWGMLYPAMAIVLCSLLFYRKMKRRVIDGNI